MSVFRSEFLASLSVHALFNALNAHIHPRLNPSNLKTEPCWHWAGTIQKSRKVWQKRVRRNTWTGDYPDLRHQHHPERPVLFLNGCGLIDPRRAMYELIFPAEGLKLYRLKPWCSDPLCINPHHMVFTELSPDPNRTRPHPSYFKQGSPFYAHKIGSWCPGSPVIEPMLESPENPLQIENEEIRASQWLPPNKPLFGNDYWQTNTLDEFYETRQGSEFANINLIPFSAFDFWQANTNSFAASWSPQVQWWIKKWGKLIPDYHLINGWSPDDLAEEWRVGAPVALSDLLARLNYWPHPRTVWDWYSRLPADQKSLINLKK